jgi:hypothetical protein
MLVSVAFAIFLTPLDRYCETMFSLTNAWAYLIGGVMLINWYYRLLQKEVEVDEFNRNHKRYVLNKCNFLIQRGYKFKYSQISWEEAFIFTKKDISIIFYYECGDNIDAGYEVQYAGQDYIYEDKQRFSVSSLVNDFNPNFNNLLSKNKIDYLISIVNDNLEKIEKLSKNNNLNIKE